MDAAKLWAQLQRPTANDEVSHEFYDAIERVDEKVSTLAAATLSGEPPSVASGLTGGEGATADLKHTGFETYGLALAILALRIFPADHRFL